MKIFRFSFLSLACLISFGSLKAQTKMLPDKPQPADRMHSGNREFWIETSLLGASTAADIITTQKSFAKNPDAFEGNPLIYGTRSIAKITAVSLAIDAAMVIATYEYKKHVTDPDLHRLWRFLLIGGIAGHTMGAIQNTR